jgi:hypothetical protein
VSGAELSHSVAPSSGGSLPITVTRTAPPPRRAPTSSRRRSSRRSGLRMAPAAFIAPLPTAESRQQHVVLSDDGTLRSGMQLAEQRFLEPRRARASRP